MDLPVRIVEAAPAHPVVSVDGALGAPTGTGLELSHWPGNRTPADLRHDLSTGSALAFARLPDAERRRRAGGALAIVNNHYDTDGACALFAVRHPRAALEREERLLAAARAGDFYQVPDLDAHAVDALVEGLADPERSPLARELAGKDDPQRWDLALAHLLERLPAILDGDLAPYQALWEPAREDLRADLADLAAARRSEERALDLVVWEAPAGLASSRSGARGLFDPGRHALFGSSAADRALVLGALPGGGTTARLVLSTLSWFDLASGPRRPRPDLAALARRLGELEGTGPGAELAWRTQDRAGPSPELWFGRADQPRFAEHSAALAPSALAPAAILREVRAALAPDA